MLRAIVTISFKIGVIAMNATVSAAQSFFSYYYFFTRKK